MNIYLCSIGKQVIPYHFFIKDDDNEIFNLSFAAIPRGEHVYSRYIGCEDSVESENIFIAIKWVIAENGPVTYSSEIQFDIRKLLKKISSFKIIFIDDTIIVLAESLDKAILLSVQKGLPINEDLDKIYMPLPLGSLSDYCASLPIENVFDLKCVKERFKQYNFRYLLFGSSGMKFCKTFVSSFDMTYDKTNDGVLYDYHFSGMPSKLSIGWCIMKANYTAYFWMDETQLNIIFERFYGAHPETKADFIIRIDAENKKYELALFRQGLKEPLIIPEAAYQLIVFKNNFEDYRSENYNQPRGAWIW